MRPRTAALARRRATRSTAVLAASALLSATGCGGDEGGAEHRFGSFTECTSVGRVTSSTDPAGDQRGRLAGAPPEPQGDLLAVGFARAGGRLCVEFRARAPIEPAAAYVVVLRPRGADTPVVRLEATVLAAATPEALLDAGGRGDAFRKVDARVGIRGDRLSVVVDRDVFAAHGVAKVFDAFRYQARAAVATEDRGSLTDCAPSCA